MVNELVKSVEKVEVSRKTPRFKLGRLIQVYVTTKEDTRPDNTIIEEPAYSGIFTTALSYIKKLFLPPARIHPKVGISNRNLNLYT